jgi:hypothetical protein
MSLVHLLIKSVEEISILCSRSRLECTKSLQICYYRVGNITYMLTDTHFCWMSKLWSSYIRTSMFQRLFRSLQLRTSMFLRLFRSLYLRASMFLRLFRSLYLRASMFLRLFRSLYLRASMFLRLFRSSYLRMSVF